MTEDPLAREFQNLDNLSCCDFIISVQTFYCALKSFITARHLCGKRQVSLFTEQVECLPQRLQYNSDDPVVRQFQLAFTENKIVEDEVANPVELVSFEAHFVLVPLLKIDLLHLSLISKVGEE